MGLGFCSPFLHNIPQQSEMFLQQFMANFYYPHSELKRAIHIYQAKQLEECSLECHLSSVRKLNHLSFYSV